MKKMNNGNGRLETHGRCGRKKTKSHFVKFDTIWVHLDVEKHVIVWNIDGVTKRGGVNQLPQKYYHRSLRCLIKLFAAITR